MEDSESAGLGAAPQRAERASPFVDAHGGEGPATVARLIAGAARRLAPNLPMIVTVAAALLLVVDANWSFMHPKAVLIFPPDEGYAEALGWRLLGGQHLPYVDGVSHRGPVFYWSIALALKVFGTGTWMPMRALTLVCMLVLIALGVFSATLSGRPLAGAIFAIALPAVWTGSLLVMDGLAYNSELLLDAFAFTALASVTLAVRSSSARRRLWLIAIAGVFTMLSALSKQVGIVLVVPFGLSITAHTLSLDVRGPRRYVPLAIYAGAVLAPFLVLVIRYAAASELSTFWYYFYTYNREVYGGALQGAERARVLHDTFLGRFDFILVCAPVIGLSAARVLAKRGTHETRLAAYAASGFESTVLLGFAVTLLASNASLRNFPHYYLQTIPWAALLGGLVVERALQSFAEDGELTTSTAFVTRSLVLLPMIAVAGLGWHYRKDGHRRDKDLRAGLALSKSPMCKFLRKHSSSADSTFIWGFDPAPYTACERRPASRYVFTTFVAGYVPWIGASHEVEEARATPHSRELLIEDLEREKPPVIFDSAPSLAGHSLMDIPVLAQYVNDHYCQVEKITPAAYLRKNGDQCPE